MRRGYRARPWPAHGARGRNNTGKSSFIYALLSLVQRRQVPSRHRLLLTGDWVDLGPFDEVLSPDCRVGEHIGSGSHVVSRDLLSKATRNEFREAFVGLVLRDIDMIFDGARLRPNEDFTSPLSGQRRNRVEQYYANVAFTSVSDVARVVVAYAQLLERLRPKPGVHGGPFGADDLVERLLRCMKQDGFTFDKGRFTSQKLRSASLSVASLVALTEESIAEHIEKARAKIEAGDHAGAITNTYTLVEEFLKDLLRRSNTPFNPDDGDIRSLYRSASTALNLSPAGQSLEGYLKAILQGFTGQVAGLYEVANKAGDRHARRYNPAKHHAKLAVNAAFTLCEFLLDSFEYQSARTRGGGQSEKTSVHGGHVEHR